MAQTSHQNVGDLIGQFLSVADLLEDAQLAQLYAYLARRDEATVQQLMDDLDIPQGTAYSYVNRLVEAGLFEVTRDEQPRAYAARSIELTVQSPTQNREYTISPALIDAVGRRTTDDDIDTYIDRHGVAGLATALNYTKARERGEVTHRMMADDLDISPLAAEMILQALRQSVLQYEDLEASGESTPDIEGEY